MSAVVRSSAPLGERQFSLGGFFFFDDCATVDLWRSPSQPSPFDYCSGRSFCLAEL